MGPKENFVKLVIQLKLMDTSDAEGRKKRKEFQNRPATTYVAFWKYQVARIRCARNISVLLGTDGLKAPKYPN